MPSRAAASLRLASSYPDQRLGREVPYAARRVGLGFVMMLVAGFLSGLLGIEFGHVPGGPGDEQRRLCAFP